MFKAPPATGRRSSSGILSGMCSYPTPIGCGFTAREWERHTKGHCAERICSGVGGHVALADNAQGRNKEKQIRMCKIVCARWSGQACSAEKSKQVCRWAVHDTVSCYNAGHLKFTDILLLGASLDDTKALLRSSELGQSSFLWNRVAISVRVCQLMILCWNQLIL